MTATLERPAAPDRLPERPTRRDRRWWAIATTVVIGWSIWSAGLDLGEVVNERGWGQLRSFFAAMFSPDLSGELVELAVREAGVTVGYALLGTALALVIGSIGGVLLTERIWTSQTGVMGRGRYGWIAAKVTLAIPRSMHEVIFGLLLVNILGLDPLVAVLAIGIPFGAVTSKVFAELLDDVPHDAELALRASGAGRLTALLFGTVPQALGDLLSYAFYRFECSLRSAAVLGIVGAGGLGFQLSLSFQSLRYDEMWTFLWMLILLSGIADRWSSAVRRRRHALAAETHVDDAGPAASADRSAAGPEGDRFLRFSALAITVAIPIAWWRLGVDLSNLWSDRARTLAGELVADAWPPEIGDGGVRGLVEDSIDTIALAVLSIAIAFALAAPLAFLARRPPRRPRSPAGALRLAVSMLLRFAMLVARSVPPPVWAFVIVFVLFPGLWPGAVALGIYNAGVLGRLQGEVLENDDQRPARLLGAIGATAPAALTVATVPAVAGRFVALGLYRWEVAIRETVIVGVVGAAGLGRRFEDQTSAFDYDGILATIVALFIVTIAVDFASAAIRRSLR
ncbi:MAG: ABC transporter permease subunit [Actinomycetota bacterium]